MVTRSAVNCPKNALTSSEFLDSGSHVLGKATDETTDVLCGVDFFVVNERRQVHGKVHHLCDINRVALVVGGMSVAAAMVAKS